MAQIFHNGNRLRDFYVAVHVVGQLIFAVICLNIKLIIHQLLNKKKRENLRWESPNRRRIYQPATDSYQTTVHLRRLDSVCLHILRRRELEAVE